jgi:spore coat protein CotH
MVLLIAACGGGDSGGPPPSDVDSSAPNPVFNEDVLATYSITMDPDDWQAIVDDPFDNTWRTCDVVWQGESYPTVGIRPSGERSRIPGNPKPSIRLEFDLFVPDREFHDLSTLKLDAVYHDESMLRARIQYPLYPAIGVPAPRYVHARVFVNGAYKGLYGVEERIGREYLRKRLGEPVSQLYEWTEAESDVVWLGSSYNYVSGMWLPDIQELPAEEDAVRNLVDILNNNPGAANTVFEIDTFVAFIAAEVLAGEGDAYLAGGSVNRTENMYLYRKPATGRFMFLPWDRDQGFFRSQTSITFGFDLHILTENLILARPDKLALYRSYLQQLLNGPWSTATIHARIDAIHAQIAQAAAEDTLKPYSTSTVASRIQSIKNYIAARNAAFQQQLGP